MGTQKKVLYRSRSKRAVGKIIILLLRKEAWKKSSFNAAESSSISPKEKRKMKMAAIKK